MAHKVTVQPECGLIQSDESTAGKGGGNEVARGHEEEEVNLLPKKEKKPSHNSYDGV